MRLTPMDWAIVALYFALTLAIGAWASRRAGRDTTEYFLSGRSMPWWLLGVSMVATTFSTDTPNLVTDIVRQNGVAGNWVWWAFLLTGMLTVFVYAKLWRRAGVLTDLEFYEIRYSGRPAAFLRGFRAIYLGVFFNIMIMATVTLAAIKIGGVMLGVPPLTMVLLAGGVTVAFSMLGGLRGVLLTDFLLFFTAIGGSVAAAVVAVGHPEVGGLSGLVTHPDLAGKLSLLPDFGDTTAVVTLLILPLAVQWWSVWYPGAEPGGGGYVAQRMLSAKDETDATAATLLFNAAHYALRPWPWILVGLASLIVFPTVDSLRAAFPDVSPEILGHDLAYPAMLTFLPAGVLGIVVASLAAAYMSTISTHLNWGASYVVHDVWKRFIEPDADERRLVFVGRVVTALLMALAAALALWLTNALQAFQILLQIGAGTGLLFILRWFWWRINAFSELTAMAVSFVVAVYVELIHPQLFPTLALGPSLRLVIGVGITTVAWVGVTYLTRPTAEATLRRFYTLVRPGGPGWRAVVARPRAGGVAERARSAGHAEWARPDASARTPPAEIPARDRASGIPVRDRAAGVAALPDPEHGWTVPQGILAMVAGTFAVYAALFAIGYALYGRWPLAVGLALASAAAVGWLVRLWPRVTGEPVGPEPARRAVGAGAGSGEDGG